MCVPDQWMYWLEWWSPPHPHQTSTHPPPLLSSGTDQRNKRHSASQPHTGTGGKHSVPALTQHNHNHKCTNTHTSSPIYTHTSRPQHSKTHTPTWHFCIKYTQTQQAHRAGMPPNTHSNWHYTLAPTTVHYPPHYNTGKNQIKLEQSKLRLFQLAAGWGGKSTGLCYPSMRLSGSCS